MGVPRGHLRIPGRQIMLWLQREAHFLTPLGTLLGILWDSLGTLWLPCGALWVSLGTLLRPSRDPLGTLWTTLGTLRDPLGPFGTVWDSLGSPLGGSLGIPRGPLRIPGRQTVLWLQREAHFSSVHARFDPPKNHQKNHFFAFGSPQTPSETRGERSRDPRPPSIRRSNSFRPLGGAPGEPTARPMASLDSPEVAPWPKIV